MVLAIFGVLWHVFAITGMLMMVPHGKRWEGFYICLVLGPIGLVIVLFMRDRLRAEAQAEALRAEVASLRAEIVDRLPNGQPMGSQGF
ncbi:MAG: hypothetical protein K0Q91_597 [Fibrobacteria bacterium]|jgi:hypothetical protein|nr:hypothetical protein [Fibrobacteria bacterium]